MHISHPGVQSKAHTGFSDISRRAHPFASSPWGTEGTPMLTILDAIRDKALFAPWFRDPSTWRAWFAFLSALFALPMDTEGRGPVSPPHKPVRAAQRLGRRSCEIFRAAM